VTSARASASDRARVTLTAVTGACRCVGRCFGGICHFRLLSLSVAFGDDRTNMMVCHMDTYIVATDTGSSKFEHALFRDFRRCNTFPVYDFPLPGCLCRSRRCCSLEIHITTQILEKNPQSQSRGVNTAALATLLSCFRS